MPQAEEIGGVIRARRKELGITQETLADSVGLPAAQTVSDIERGQREVKAWELVKIAEALHTTVDNLLGLETEPVSARVMWRRGSEGESRETEERLFDRARRYALLERWNDLPSPPPLPQHELDPQKATFRDAASIAQVVGRLLDLGSRPAAALPSVLQEGFRVKLFFEDLGEGESAASAKGDFGCAILMNANEAPWRRNYNLAHELFHLVTWDSTVRAWGDGEESPEWMEHVEKLANAFASHLLLPAEEVENQFELRFATGEITYPELVEMAREFEVSTEALVWRLRLMGKLKQEEAERILADPEFRRLDRRSMRGRWASPSPESLPQRYVRLAANAYHRGEVSLAKVAKMLEMPLSEAGMLLLEEADEPQTAAAPA